jgi:hypothetical protein
LAIETKKLRRKYRPESRTIVLTIPTTPTTLTIPKEKAGKLTSRKPKLYPDRRTPYDTGEATKRHCNDKNRSDTDENRKTT